MKKLNLGAGNFPAPSPWINIDSYSGVNPDLVHDISEGLPYKDEEVSSVYMGHCLEHLTKDQVADLLKEVHRVLARGGSAVIVGPDVDLARERFPEALSGALHGDHRWEGDEHQWESTGAETKRIVESTELFMVTEVPIDSKDLDEWPVTSRIGWQFSLLLWPVDLDLQEDSESEEVKEEPVKKTSTRKRTTK